MIDIMKQLHRNALEAVRELADYCAVSETMAEAQTEYPIPWDTFYLVKAGQALKALKEFKYNHDEAVAPISGADSYAAHPGDAMWPIASVPPKMLDAVEISMGYGAVDIGPFTWGTRKGVLLAPRSYIIPPGQPGRLQNQEYWPVRGDVVIWIDQPGAGAGIVEELQKL